MYNNNSISQYQIPVAVLAGSNSGRALEKEEKEKKSLKERLKQKFLSPDKLYLRLDNDKTVLRNTIDALVSCPEIDNEKSFVLGDEKKILRTDSNSYFRIEEQKPNNNSLFDTLNQAVETLYKDGYKGNSLIICGDVPAIRPCDVSEYIRNSLEKEVDVSMGMVDIDEVMELYNQDPQIIKSGKLRKGSIPLINDNGEFDKSPLKPHYANIFMINEKFYENREELQPRYMPALGLKKLFNNPDNFEHLSEILKNEGVEIKKYPRSMCSMIGFALTRSKFLKKLLIENYIFRASNPFRAVKLSEVENIATKRILGENVSGKIIKAPARFGFDADDENDIKIINALSCYEKSH